MVKKTSFKTIKAQKIEQKLSINYQKVKKSENSTNYN